MYSSMSLIHLLCEGGDECFHLRRISRLPSRVMNAIKSYILFLKAMPSGLTPNIEMRGFGSIERPEISLKDLKISLQNLSRTGQSQNMWARVHGEWLHLLHAGSKLGKILANLEFVIWSRCRTLNWLSPCLAQGEEAWTWSIIPSHSTSEKRKFKSCSQARLRWSSIWGFIELIIV